MADRVAVAHPWGWIALIFVAACGTDTVQRSWWRIDVGRATVGEEVREQRGGQIVASRQYRLLVAGESVDADAVSTWQLTADGRVRTYDSGDRSAAFELDNAPYAWFAPPPTGPVSLFDPSTATSRSTRVFERDGSLFADLDPPWWAELSEGHVVASGVGPVAMRQVPGPVPRWDPIDPARELAWDLEVPAGARRLVVTVDGIEPGWIARSTQVWHNGHLEIDRPLRAEIPHATAASLDAAAERVRARLSPNRSPDSGEAIAFGIHGDCKAHAAAFVQEMSGLGLTARVVVGWARPPGADGTVLLPHAWVEVDLGSPLGWLAVDPTLRQTVADASHIGLSEQWLRPMDGGTPRPWEGVLAGSVARLAVVEVR